jgi:hypothetical protein
MGRAFRVSVRFAILYAVLLAAVAVSPLAGPMSEIVATTAAHVLTACTSRPVVSSVVDGSIGLAIVPEDGRQPAWAAVDALGHTINVPLFIAIVVAMGTARAGTRLSYQGLGLCGLVLLGLVGLDGAVVGFEGWGRWPAGIRPPANACYEVLGTLAVLHGTGGVFVAPAFIGAFCAMVLVRPPSHAVRARSRRNDPCPCGSGLKVKRCCGRA